MFYNVDHRLKTTIQLEDGRVYFTTASDPVWPNINKKVALIFQKLPNKKLLKVIKSYIFLNTLKSQEIFARLL